jgi:1-acyl-sn-glycerol-3-phosphate acyltransferase
MPSLLTGIVASLLLALNTVVLVPVLLVVALLRLLLPVPALRDALTRLATAIANLWISGNSAWMRLTQRTVWDVQGLDGLNPRGWVMVTSNHQSWVDILVLQHQLNGRIPLLKFFLKQQLIWVPFMGLAWWALEFPFMRRHTEAQIKANPALREQDQETTRRACAKFARTPTSVMNFLEGTRFTPAKHARQASPYRHLLKPKAGGLALALNAMGEKFQAILDVTIVYPDGVPSFWQFLCGGLKRVVVRMRTLPVPQHLLGADYTADAAVREAYAQWVQQLWAEKDALIGGLLPAPAPAAAFR